MNLSENKIKYKTIGKSIPVEIKEKGSKFVGYAYACSTETETKQKLEELRELHPQATHICYAFRLGIDGEKYRANDDGEPNNSAGMPILGQIISKELTNILVAVVRYYGGTKLGVGGLVSAYKECAQEVLKDAVIIEKEVKNYFELICTYEDMPYVMAVLKRNRLNIVENEMTHNCRLIVQMSLLDDRNMNELLSRYESVEIKWLKKR